MKRLIRTAAALLFAMLLFCASAAGESGWWNDSGATGR